MYALHTIPGVNQTRDTKLKYEESLHRKAADGAIKSRPLSQKRRHESTSAVERRSEPWMKHLTLSSTDLMWDSCNSKEEEFMNVSHSNMSLQQAASQSFSSIPLDPLAKMAAALASLPGNHSSIAMPGNNHDIPMDSSDQHDLPRFRQDLVSGHDDVELKMQALQTTLFRSISSSSLSALEGPRLSYSTSFVASQQEIMSQILLDSQTWSSGALDDQQQEAEASGHHHHANISARGSSHIALSATRTPRTAITKNSSRNRCCREETLDGTGSKVRIHDEERVFAAMNQGTASLLQCVGCARHMMATSDIKLVYCPGCGTLTPFEMGLVPNTTPRGGRA